jgi:hypothetical protein
MMKMTYEDYTVVARQKHLLVDGLLVSQAWQCGNVTIETVVSQFLGKKKIIRDSHRFLANPEKPRRESPVFVSRGAKQIILRTKVQ